jgi:hypothetical protein
LTGFVKNTAKPLRPKSPKTSEQMKAWSSALEYEVADWPEITASSFFGFTAIYRGERIFALLPRTRSMWKTNSIGIKLESPSARVRQKLEQDPRVVATRMRQARWFAFELSSDIDLHDALDWLGTAYQTAGKKTKPGNKPA